MLLQGEKAECHRLDYFFFLSSPSPSFDYPCENKPLSLPGKETLLLSLSHLHFSLLGPGQANAQEKDKRTQMLKRQWGCAVMQIYQSLNARVRIIFELNEALAFSTTELLAKVSILSPHSGAMHIMGLTKWELTQIPWLTFNPITRLNHINAGQPTGAGVPLFKWPANKSRLLLGTQAKPRCHRRAPTLNPSAPTQWSSFDKALPLTQPAQP